MKEVFDFLRACKTYYLATIEGDQPRVRPFGSMNLFEGKFYFLTGKSKPISRQMAENPKVELSGVSGGKWIRIAATVVDDNRREAKKSILDFLPHLRSTYSEDDEETQVLYLKDAVATISSFGEEPKVITF